MTQRGLIIDLFAGGGGASTAILMATGRHPDIAVNHNPIAVDVHQANHPETRHYRCDVREVDPVEATGGRPVDLLWASPDCTHFSKARGGKPVEKRIRSLADVVVVWASAVRPKVIALENVEEFKDWGPVLEDGKPCPERKGLDFRRWVKELKDLGYVVDWRELVAADYGAPTTRKRLFLIARCDGRPISWPTPTHASRAKLASRDLFDGPRKPWRAAAEIIDWNIPVPSIFGRARPLKPKTRARIAKGLKRYVIESPRPFIVPVTHTKSGNTASDQVPTMTTAKGGEFAITAPSILPLTHAGSDERVYDPADALRTITAANRGEIGLAATFLQKMAQNGQGTPLDAPVDTVMAGATKHHQIAASLDAYYATGVAASAGEPLRTATAKGRHGLTGAYMEQANTGVVGHEVRAPVSTILEAGSHQRLIQVGMAPANDLDGSSARAQVVAFLWEHFGQPTESEWADPVGTPGARLKFGLVVIDGLVWQIVDIGMRMLTPRELFNAQGFPADYVIEVTFDGRPVTKTAQTSMAGNSVSPPPAAAMLRANLPEDSLLKEAA